MSAETKYFHPTEVDLLIGDSTKANTILGWIPEHHFAFLASDVKLVKKGQYLKYGGYGTLNYFE